MIGKTIEDVNSDSYWFINNTFNQQQFLEYKAYAIPLIKKVLKCNKSKAEEAFNWLNLEFGLKVVPTKEEHENILIKMKEDPLNQ